MVTHQGVKYWTVNFPVSISQDHIMLEEVGQAPAAMKCLYILDMTQKSEIIIGRGHEADLRITDISCSRVHAVIRRESDGFYLNDKDSKFGTLVDLQSDLKLTPEWNDLQIQVGHTVFKLRITINPHALEPNHSNPGLAGPVKELDPGSEIEQAPAMEYLASSRRIMEPQEESVHQLDNEV
jgi:predicted component of type VI protein secretion system